jgi:hypothetical protein
MVQLRTVTNITGMTGPYPDHEIKDVLDECLGSVEAIAAFSAVLRSAMRCGWTDEQLGDAIGPYLRRAAKDARVKRDGTRIMTDPVNPSEESTHAVCESCKTPLYDLNVSHYALKDGDHWCTACHQETCSHDDCDVGDNECDLCGAEGLAEGRD